jgi:hypothetical protein
MESYTEVCYAEIGLTPGPETPVLSEGFLIGKHKRRSSNGLRSHLESLQVQYPTKCECIIEFDPSQNNRIRIEF